MPCCNGVASRSRVCVGWCILSQHVPRFDLQRRLVRDLLRRTGVEALRTERAPATHRNRPRVEPPDLEVLRQQWRHSQHRALQGGNMAAWHVLHKTARGAQGQTAAGLWAGSRDGTGLPALPPHRTEVSRQRCGSPPPHLPQDAPQRLRDGRLRDEPEQRGVQQVFRPHRRPAHGTCTRHGTAGGRRHRTPASEARAMQHRQAPTPSRDRCRC